MNEIKEKEKVIIDKLANILEKIIDAKSKENFTEDNQKIAMVDTLKLLNLTYNKICTLSNADAKKIFNKYQEFYFKAITKVNKKVKNKLLELNTNLWRVYLFTLFKSKEQEELLENLTGWSYAKFPREEITPDMKIMLLSVIHIEDNKEEKNKDNN